MERTRRETRIQRAALVCKPPLSSSAILHFPAFPNVPVWAFTISCPLPIPPTLSSMNPHFLFHLLYSTSLTASSHAEQTAGIIFREFARGEAAEMCSLWHQQLGPQRGGKKICAPTGGWTWIKFAGCFVIQTHGATALSKKLQDDEILMALEWRGTKEWNFAVQWSESFLGVYPKRCCLP